MKLYSSIYSSGKHCIFIFVIYILYYDQFNSTLDQQLKI